MASTFIRTIIAICAVGLTACAANRPRPPVVAGSRDTESVAAQPARTVNLAADDSKLFPRAKITTRYGSFVVKLDAKAAAAPVLTFLQYAKKGYYDGTIFHRIRKDSLIQGGGFTPDMKPKPATYSSPDLPGWMNDRRNEMGTIAIRRGRGTAGTGMAEFYINVVNNRRLDGKEYEGLFAVIGDVISGFDTVERIAAVAVGTHPDYAGGTSAVVPTSPIIIQSVTVLDPIDPDAIREAVASQMIPHEQLINDTIKRFEKKAGRKVVTTESGLRYVDLVIGKGPQPIAGDFIEFQYRGTLADGTVFETTLQSEPAKRPVDNLVPGMKEGLMGMNEGGERVLIIPPKLAFPEGIPGTIPGHATLIFEIELLGIIGRVPPSSEEPAP